MSNTEKFFSRANLLLDRLEKLLPTQVPDKLDPSVCSYRWQYNGNTPYLKAITEISDIRLMDLLRIERQKQAIIGNTRQFLANLPANNVLLWGPRGTGKSSLIKAVLNEYSDSGLKLIEVARDRLVDLPDIVETLSDDDMHYIIYCDDLSFEANDVSYKTLKVVLDGSIYDTPKNVLIYATSNRRHLIPEYMSENTQSGMQNGELHMSETVEEKISLSERFGLWISFHPFNQNDYLHIVDHWLAIMGVETCKNPETRAEALRWALEHGSRSGRSAWQFARHWSGKLLLDKTHE